MNASRRAASQREGLPVFANRQRRGGRAWLLTAIVLAGAALRIAPLADNRFHPDEALYAALGRLIASGRDPLLAHTPLLVDKPPLFYTTLAGGVALAWSSELAARLPGLMASLIGLALVARLGWQVWRSPVAAVLATLITAFSPFAILFAPTAFADPLLVTWGLAALAAVTSIRGARASWLGAGLLLGAAVATKQSGLAFVPPVVALGVIRHASPGMRWRDAAGWLLPFALGLGGVLVLVAGWDALRAPAQSFWTLGVAANNPGRLARSGEVWARAVGWLGWLRYLGGASWVSALLLVLAAAAVPLEVVMRPGTRGAAASLVLVATVLGYLAFHWLVAFPLIDRYLLPVVPLLALLAGRTLSLLADWGGEQLGLNPTGGVWLAGLVLAALLASPAVQAARSAYPVGGDHGAYDGIDTVATILRALPEGSVVYHDGLGWLLAYYLFDAPLYVAPFDAPAALTADLRTFGGDGVERVLVLPGWQSQYEVLAAVQAAGFRANLEFETANRHGGRSFAVYRLTPGME